MFRYLIALAACALLAPSAASAHGPRYILGLGDSLSVGVQPDGPPPLNETNTGFNDQLVTLLHEPGLQAAKLGCGGESTTSFIKGSQLPTVAASCGPPDFYASRYPQGTQLATAVEFLRTHRGRVPLVTVALGSNNAIDCIATGSVECIASRAPTIDAELGTVLQTLRQAGARRIVGMTYYNPVLGLWPADIARTSNDAMLALNAQLTSTYRAAHVRVADVAGAFQIIDFGLHGGTVPRNAALACAWTWFCTPPPLGPNVHPNTVGYGVIARAFLEVLHRHGHGHGGWNHSWRRRH